MAAGNSAVQRRANNYTTADGVTVVADAFSHVSTALASTGNEAASVDSGIANVGRFKVVTANVTGTIVVTVQTSQDNSTWVTVAATSALGNAATAYVNGALARYVRLAWTIVTGPADITVTGDLIA
jgi:hypothetical protein